MSQIPGSEQTRVKLLCGADLLESFATPDLWSDEHVCELNGVWTVVFSNPPRCCVLQIKGIIGEFGLVVVSRGGHNAEKFVYESDKLFPLKVQ